MFHCECHYTCDGCGRVLDASVDQRYVLRISACGDEVERGMEDDRDYLDEIDQRLICAQEFGDELAGDRLTGDEDAEVAYDLCAGCRQKFSLDPLGRRSAASLDFSQN